jgi:hypothetical protein
MFNRVRHFIKTITLNPGLNREKFINNKKNVNKIKNKNKNNMTIIRKMSTYANPSGNGNNNNNNNNNNNDYIYMFIMALSASYIPYVFNKKN